MYWYSVSRLMANSRARAALFSPALARFRRFLARSAVSDGLRPLYLPSFFAIAIPSRWRSRIRLRSNSPKLPSTLNSKLAHWCIVAHDHQSLFDELHGNARLIQIADNAAQIIEIAAPGGLASELQPCHLPWRIPVAP